MCAATGSPTSVNTIGTLGVAFFAACVAASWLVKIRSTPPSTSAAAAAGIALSLPWVKRMSNVTSRPSCRPRSLSPAFNPSTVGWLAAHAALRTPIRHGRRVSCAAVRDGEPESSSATASHENHRWMSVGHEPMVGALRNVVLLTQRGLEFREGRAHLAGHPSRLGLFRDHFGRQLLEIAQDRHRQLDDLDLALELDLEPLQRDGVLDVVLGEAIDLNDLGGVFERAPKIHRKRLAGLLVEPEAGHGAGLVPAGIVVARGV